MTSVLDQLEQAIEEAVEASKTGDASQARPAFLKLDRLLRSHAADLIAVARAAQRYQYGDVTLVEMRDALAPLAAPVPEDSA